MIAMVYRRRVALWLAAACGCFLLVPSPALMSAEPSAVPTAPLPLTYPATARGDVVDDYHGQSIADPYRWLEDPDSEPTRAWVAEQNKLTFDYLTRLPLRQPLRQRLTELWNYERYGLPMRRGGRYFFTRNDGLQNQSVLYVADALDAEPRVLLDPNVLAADGTIALTTWSVSDNGRYLAYALATGGSDWREWRVRDVDSGADLPDRLEWAKFSGASWTSDNAGFYYSRYDAPPPGEQFTAANYYQKLYYHRLGEPQANDTLVYERPDEKEWGFGGYATPDGRLLVISVWKGTERKNQLFYQRRGRADEPIVELIAGFDASYSFLGAVEDTLYVQTDLGAPKQRIVAIDLNRPDRADWREVVPEADDTLEGANLVGGRLIASYLRDAHSVVRVFALDGALERELPLPGLGTAGGFGGRPNDRETFYSFTNFTTPGAIYRYDIAAGQATLFRQPQVKFDAADYETKQVFVTSRDGARVPMFITHRRGLQPRGDAPTLLYGYGGFNVSQRPAFSVTNLAWLEQGGVYCLVNLRGGGEYGRAWHEAGRLDKKQNVFDDFIASAEWLIEHGYTRPERLVIRGGSNGGLLVAAAIVQRPELFAAAAPAVGVLDMLRFHKFTIGWAWTPEYGSADNPDQFRTLLAYSPLHNLKSGARYPAVLITTADHDDRVVPAHSFKFAAALQAAQGGQRPTLIRIETKAGHGAGKPTAKVIEEAADVLAFLLHEAGVRP